METIWKPIPGYEGLYEVSSDGRVLSLNFKRTKLPQVLTPVLGERGYHSVTLWRQKLQKRYYVHHLVLLAFIGPRYSKNVNHINAVRTDNRIENIEYCTQRQNIHHMHAMGRARKSKGSAHFRSKIKEEDVHLMKDLYAKGETQLKIGKRFGISAQQVGQILLGRAWVHV